MEARYISGRAPVNRDRASWKKEKDGARPPGLPVLHDLDKQVFKFEIASLNAKNILEFGPGDSTEFFSSLGLHITTVEHSEKWYEAAKERFKDYPNVRVLKGEDEMPFIVHGMGAHERFDLAFVDAPQGFFPARKAHKGYEDCSRFNTTLFALQRAPVVLLHDINRPLERGTLGRLNKMGYHVETISVPYGMARITHGDENPIDLPRTEELGGATAGGKPRQRHGASPKRPRGRPPRGDGKA